MRQRLERASPSSAAGARAVVPAALLRKVSSLRLPVLKFPALKLAVALRRVLLPMMPGFALVLLLSSLACGISRPHLVHDFSALGEVGEGDRLLHAVVEIPAGTNAKWEVEKESGQLRWEQEGGVPRVVQYLAYPGNYGMVPRTALPRSEGGDGDPLDLLVLGPALERGTMVSVRLIGVLHLVDEGERDDKLLAVPQVGPFSELRELAQLRERYPGSLEILETWFTNYKGAGRARSEGFGDRQAALRILNAAMSAYEATSARP